MTRSQELAERFVDEMEQKLGAKYTPEGRTKAIVEAERFFRKNG